jgi:hypothetical protein
MSVEWFMCKLYSVIVYLMSRFLAVELLSFRFEAAMDMFVLLSTIHYACGSTAKNRKNQTRAWLHSRSLKKRQQQLPCRELRCKTNLYTWRWPNSPKHALYKNNKQTPWPGSASELYRPSDCCRRSYCQLLRIEGCRVVSTTDPY